MRSQLYVGPRSGFPEAALSAGGLRRTAFVARQQFLQYRQYVVFTINLFFFFFDTVTHTNCCPFILSNLTRVP